MNGRQVVWCMCCAIIASAVLIPLGSALTLNPVGSGSQGTQMIANGDPVTISGIATGHPRDGLQVWIIGKNYLKISTVQVNSDNTFDFELRSSDTLNLASGQYYVVIQHPMMNGQFDVYYDSASGDVINRQLGTGGMAIYQMSGGGSLQGPASAQALISAISSQNIDDSFTTYTFMISPPSSMIDPIGDHVVGEKFTISGSTNLAAGDKLMVDITSSSFKPTLKTAPGGFSGANGEVTVAPGSGGYNRWSFDVDTSVFSPDEYIVTVSGITIDVTASTNFNLYERLPATMVTPEKTPMNTAVVPTITSTSLPLPTTAPAKSPVNWGIITLGLAVAILVKKAGQ